MALAQIIINASVTFWPELTHFLSFLNSHPSPNFRRSRAMPTDPLTATVSPKAKKIIKAIVSIFLSFKNLCGASGVEPVKDPSVTLLTHRCPHGFGGDRTPARVSRRDADNLFSKKKRDMQNKNPNMTFPSAEGVNKKQNI